MPCLLALKKKISENKHKGGNNNSKGNIYESFYTTYCIALFMNSHITQLDSVHFTSQLEECFVDDLLIEESNTAHRIYHQIKDVKIYHGKQNGCNMILNGRWIYHLKWEKILN